jgi:hypothetical protein
MLKGRSKKKSVMFKSYLPGQATSYPSTFGRVLTIPIHAQGAAIRRQISIQTDAGVTNSHTGVDQQEPLALHIGLFLNPETTLASIFQKRG